MKKLIAKLKSIKNGELYLAATLAIVALAIIFCGTSTKQDKTGEVCSDFDAYIASMENKISSVVEKMDGCKGVEVVISCEAVDQKVYAYQTETKNSNGVVTETNSVVMVNGQPLVLKTLPPAISGVVVVVNCQNDAATKMKIKQLVVTLLQVSTDKVQVFTYKN